MEALTKHFRDRILLLLSDYVRSPSEDNVKKLNLGMKSTIELENLDIREDLLLMNSIPLVINEGKINRIQITVPTLYKTTPARIDVENVMIRVRLLVEQRGNDDMLKLMSKTKTNFGTERTFGSGSYKEQKLKDWDDKMMKYFTELAPPTWMKKIIDNILKNMIISIKNLNIYYESFSLLNRPSLAKISLQELNLHSTIENWTPGFNSNPKVKFRELSIKGLAVTLNINSKKRPAVPVEPPVKQEPAKSKTSPVSKKKTVFSDPQAPTNKTKHIAFKSFNEEEEDVEAEYTKLRGKDVYLLFPLDLNVRMRTELDLSKDFESEPQQLFLVDVKEAIILMLNKDHMKFLGALNEHLRLMNIVQKNLHLRPIEPPKRRLKEWWKYAIKAVLEEKKRQSDFSKDPGSLWKMKKYIDLYKRQQGIISVPWLPRITEKEKPLFKRLENEVPLQNLIQFREWAFIEIRVEAKRFATLNKDVQGMKPLIDVWFHILNNEDMFKSSSKDDYAETIRLTPLEQTDLYEILALDKAKVLESYLKGENNDPKDISMNLKINLASFYIMISERKWHSSAWKRQSSVRDWWIQPWQHQNMNMLASDVSARLTESIVLNGSHIKNKASGHSPTFQSLYENDGISPVHSRKPDHISIKMPNRDDDDGSRISVKSQSFAEHMRDVDREVESKYLIHEPEDGEETEEDQADTNVGALNTVHSTWWNQSLLLIFEILDITTSINKYRSGRLSTEGEKPMEFGSIMITTPFNLPKATKQRKVKSSLEGTGLHYENLLQNILAYDFNSVPSVGQRDSNPFIAYLKSKGLINIAGFLEIFEKDKRNTGEVIVNNIKAYRPFFREDDPLYIEQLNGIKKNFENYLRLNNAIKETKERIIENAYAELEKHILKTLLPPFLFSHGILVLPLILQANTLVVRDADSLTQSLGGKIDIVFKTLKNASHQLTAIGQGILGRVTKKIASAELTDTPLNLFFDIEGTESKFKIKKIDLPSSKLHTPQLFGKGLVVDLIEDKEPSEGQSFIKLNVQPVTIHLSIECLKPLILFFKSFSNSHAPETNYNEPPEEASVRDYEKMIDCIHYNKDREKEIHFVEGPRLEARFNMITIKVSNFIPNYRQERELNFSFSDILYKVKNPNSSELAPSLETKRLQTYYVTKSLRIEGILLEEVVTKETGSFAIQILRAGIIFYLYDCLFKNHPLYTDQKIHALIPFFNLTIDDGALLFLQTIKMINILTTNPPKPNIMLVSMKTSAGQDLVMGSNQRNMLINRFKVLRNDHKESNKACKHCILRYKKSQTVLNLFFGDLGKYCSTLIATPFHNLYSVLENSPSRKAEQGMIINMTHSLVNTEEKISQTLLYIPFLSVTRDQGFFKDNLIIHCTESTKPSRETNGGKESIDFKIKPMIKVTNQFMANLDEKFWRYFKDFEKFFRQKEDKSNSESMQSVEPSNNSSIKSDKLEGEKLFTIESDDNNEGTIETGEDRPKVYVLLARKKILLKDLACQFDIGENDMRNFFVLKLRDINIKFNALKNFCALKNTIDAFSYLNTWFDHFLQSMSIMGREFSRRNSTKIEEGITLPNLDNVIETEEIAVWIEKISFFIKIQHPQIPWLLEINQVAFETGKKSTNSSAKALQDKQVWDLFSINNINFKLTSSSSGTIRNIILKYYQKIHQLKFSIENFHHSCPSRTDHSLIRIPSDSARTRENKALKAYLLFNEGVLSKVSVSIASIVVNISKLLVVEELCAIDVYNKVSLQEKGNLPKLLRREIFYEEIFREVDKSVQQSTKERDTMSVSHKFRGPHVGPLAATEDLVVLVELNSLNARLMTDKNDKSDKYKNFVFAELDISPIEYKQDVEGKYEVRFGKVGLHPHSSFYENFLLRMSPDYPMNVKISKDNTDYPVLSIQNSKIIYMERVFAEIKEFRRDIQTEIAAASAKIAQSRPVFLEPDFSDPKTLVPKKSTFLKVQLDNSCVIVPRNSNSEDIFIALFERLDALLEYDVRTVDFPAELKRPLAVINQKLVVDTSGDVEKRPCPVMVVNANLSKLDLLYTNKELKRAIGSSDMAFLISTTPRDPLVVNQWGFDGALQAVLEKFDFHMNMACLTEIDELVSENLKEQSNVFDYRPRDWARTKVVIAGADLQVDMNLALIEAQVADDIKMQEGGETQPVRNDERERPNRRF